MDAMPLTLDWPAALARLAGALVAGAIFGLNRSESGKAAGLRTTLLVCLAACISMLQVNALLEQAGKRPDSFATLDLMRLPLGILTGMGFIGGGAVLRKDGLVTGVTTAATLWFVTVVGLCIGGGQYRLAVSATVVGVAVLWGLRYVEDRLERRKTAWLTVGYAGESNFQQRLADEFERIGCRISPRHAEWKRGEAICETRFLIQWREQTDIYAKAPAFTEAAQRAGANTVQWEIVD
ncbi:putative Mg2+ transporter-C (MgtC) family protein [Trinickia symbiotica]|uniref:Protein MgtC n=1 Tax=Trinickia symbiotica TaxID=863227 RepID=A0A2N7X235_9BURK|nr:MgtC/SapB family protein [Trinickia symbiotica]PMS35806.1 MgtC/SapB family protein [Trinickia symbiotica]PPK44559.1 putative Mg2+ transporter-C (MgtC) family protein [Trinickia symbiotica]